ncbi:hypothetical protein [Bradyrhizobium sp. NP1]|uniref:hypothetical protein n=1 Tax=Bradyrhizobium sp. NP1 TaxID=3049772 RepID=UPI0025A563F8|nr:hypothetical protein [Bradyrhizobium sp. NP1]WJR76483.1 hypothetical protein QOU61_27520 [Bradyrhizobium sp. NP1]
MEIAEKIPTLTFDKRLVSSMLTVGAAIILFLLSVSAAVAGDYIVTYAIDANGKTDTGRVDTCIYDQRCEITSARTGLLLSLRPRLPQDEWVKVEVSGPPGCCFSDDATTTI